MAKKTVKSAPEVAPETSPEVVVSAPETEVTTSATTDQPAVPADASASISPPSSSAEKEKGKAEEVKAGGGFDSPFAPAPEAPSMIDRINSLEARIAALEAK